MNKLLLNKETAYLIDKMAVDEGVSLSDLMETAGKRSAEIIINEIVPKIIIRKFMSYAALEIMAGMVL